MEIHGIERNIKLFVLMRDWAYKERSAYNVSEYDKWIEACKLKAEQFNSFEEPLDQEDATSIAESIGVWTWYVFLPTAGIPNDKPAAGVAVAATS